MSARGMIVAGVVACLAAPAAANWPKPNPWSCYLGPTKTFREEAASADTVVLYGILGNRRAVAEKVVVDLDVQKVLRSSPAYKQTRVHVIPVDVDLKDPNDRRHYLVFLDVDGKQVDPYRGVALKGGAASVEYVRKALSLRGKMTADTLAFFCRYLDDSDPEVARDAYLEVSKATPVEILRAGPKLPRDKLRHLMKDPESLSYKTGPVALLLGACGRREDVPLLKALLKKADSRESSGMDGVLVAWVLLEPRAGGRYLQEVLKNGKEEFMFRYAGLRAMRFLEEVSPYPMKKADLVAGVCLLLPQEDIADLAIEQLRRWKCWDRVGDVLAVHKTRGYKMPHVYRALLRYCLQCRGQPAAAAYITERRESHPAAVREAEELLELQQGGKKDIVS